MFRYSTAIAGVVSYAVLAVPVLLMLRGLPAREVLALRPPTRWRRALGLALAVFVACFVFAAVYGATFDPHDTAAIPSYWDGSRTGAFLANLIVIAVIAPVVEELMFRGLGYRLLERDGTRAAIVVTGVLFGLVHGYVLALPAMVFFGIAIGWLRRKTGSVYPGMLVHGTTNALIVLIAPPAPDRPAIVRANSRRRVRLGARTPPSIRSDPLGGAHDARPPPSFERAERTSSPAALSQARLREARRAVRAVASSQPSPLWAAAGDGVSVAPGA
jgi:membrane protease YdiL (CAAX protease family)